MRDLSQFLHPTGWVQRKFTALYNKGDGYGLAHESEHDAGNGFQTYEETERGDGRGAGSAYSILILISHYQDSSDPLAALLAVMQVIGDDAGDGGET